MRQPQAFVTEPPAAVENWTPRSLHALFFATHGILFVLAIVFVCLGSASSSQTYDSGPITHEAQAGIDCLASGILASVAVIVFMVHAGVRLLEITVKQTLGRRVS